MTTNEQNLELRDLISCVEIDDVRLIEGVSKTKISAEQVEPAQLFVQHDAEVASAGPGKFSVRASLIARIVPESVATEDPPLGSEVVIVAAVHELTYIIPKDKEYSSETLAQFAKLNGVFNAWPYWRHFLQTTTVEMGLPRIVMPVYRGNLGAKHRHALNLTPTGPAAPKTGKTTRAQTLKHKKKTR